MRRFTPNDDGWFCGHWNQSPLQIKYSEGRPLREEEPHAHPDFAEYFLVLSGKLTLEIDHKPVELGDLELLMVEAGEAHRIISKDDDCAFVVIKEKSYAGNKR